MYEIEDGIHDGHKWVWCYKDESKDIMESMDNMGYMLWHKGDVHGLLQIQKGRDYNCFMVFVEKVENETQTYSALMDANILAYDVKTYG